MHIFLHVICQCHTVCGGGREWVYDVTARLVIESSEESRVRLIWIVGHVFETHAEEMQDWLVCFHLHCCHQHGMHEWTCGYVAQKWWFFVSISERRKERQRETEKLKEVVATRLQHPSGFWWVIYCDLLQQKPLFIVYWLGSYYPCLRCICRTKI